MNAGQAQYKRIVKRLRTEYGVKCKVERAEMADLVMWDILTEQELYARAGETK